MSLGDITNRHSDRVSSVRDRSTANEPIGGLHRDRPDHVVADVLGDLQGQSVCAATFVALIEGDVDGESVVQLRHRLDGELHVDDRACHAGYTPDAGGGLSRCGHCRSSSFCVCLLRGLCVLRGERVGSADDLTDFLGDLGLASLVGLPGEGADEFLCIVRG